MTRYAIALGSNVGERLEHLRAAAGSLSSLGRTHRISSLFETAPVGGPPQDPFLNAVITLDSDLQPRLLLERLQKVENDRGRERLTKWGPRTLDLDLVASDGVVITDPELTVPHPRASERRFVLEPLAEVWPQALVANELAASDALEQVVDQSVDLLARRWADPRARRAGKYWVGAQFVWFVAIAFALAFDGSLAGDGLDAPRVAGGLLVVVGGLLTLLSLRKLGSSLRVLPEPRAHAGLVESGPFALVRHPIYGGVLLFILGTALLVHSLLGVLLSLVFGVFFWMKSEYEERQLRIKYPGYLAYRQRVTRRFIPFVV